jgi:hypothetical protein
MSLLGLSSSPAIIQMLLDAKADVVAPDRSYVLTSACVDCQPEAVKMLLDAGAPAAVAGKDDEHLLRTTIFAKCDKGKEADKARVYNLLWDAGASIEVLGDDPGIWDDWAFSGAECAPEVFLDLIQQRCPEVINRRYGKRRRTPLLLLLKLFTGNSNYPEMPRDIGLLLDAGADAMVVDTRGHTALDLTLMSCMDDIQSNEVISHLAEAISKRESTYGKLQLESGKRKSLKRKRR